MCTRRRQYGAKAKRKRERVLSTWWWFNIVEAFVFMMGFVFYTVQRKANLILWRTWRKESKKKKKKKKTDYQSGLLGKSRDHPLCDVLISLFIMLITSTRLSHQRQSRVLFFYFLVIKFSSLLCKGRNGLTFLIGFGRKLSTVFSLPRYVGPRVTSALTASKLTVQNNINKK